MHYRNERRTLTLCT